MKRTLERGLILSRWLLAPMYVGLVVALAALLIVAVKEIWRISVNIISLTVMDVILGTLTLLDIAMVGSLVVLVIFSGYENFVARFDADLGTDQPKTVDFSEMKLSLFASIVAISGIHLLKAFMDPTLLTVDQLKWMVITHLVFVVSTLLLAAMDWVNTKARNQKV